MTPEQFLQLSDLLPEPTLLVSAGGTVLAANRATGARLGLPPRAVRGRPLAELVADAPGDVARYLRVCSRSREMVLGALTVSGGEPCRAEGAVCRPAGGGAEALVLLRLVPKHSAAGKFVDLNRRIDELAGEIHRRRQAERALEEERARLRTTLYSIGDAVIATDPAGRVTFMNPVAEALTGWPQAEAAGRALPEVFRIVNERTREPVENPALRALREGVVVGLANHTVLIARDGAERPIDDSAAPIRDGAAAPAGAVLVFRDVTGRKRAEEALREGEERLRLAVEIARMGAFEVDLKTDAVVVNGPGREIYGWPSPHTTFSRVQGHFHPDDREEVMRRVAAALDPAGPGEFEVEQRIRRVDGAPRWIRVRGRAWFEGEGAARAAARLVGTYLDVTERREMEDALREADRKKDDFIALLAHELRNPLAPLRNGLQIMRIAAGDAGAVAQARAMMERQLSHMVRLVDDLLDVSRISRNKMDLRRERVPLADVVASAVETAGPAIDAGGHDLSVTLPGAPAYLDADPTRLAQVFSNLLTNSAKYTPKGGRISLAAERRGGEVAVSVRDDGIGIPAGSLPTIFDMFSQVDRSMERTTGGLGIGLALVKGLVEMHGGRVTAESEGEGKGSTFTVTLPVPGGHAGGAPGVPGRASGRRPARRILVVDDSRDGAESLALMLRLLGDEVETANDGVEGLERAEAFRPDVILMDVGMPRLNGLEATRHIRGRDWGKGVTIIALTGWGQANDRERSRAAGCDAHLTKPVDLADLERVLGAARA